MNSLFTIGDYQLMYGENRDWRWIYTSYHDHEGTMYQYKSNSNYSVDNDFILPEKVFNYLIDSHTTSLSRVWRILINNLIHRCTELGRPLTSMNMRIIKGFIDESDEDSLNDCS